MKRVITEFRGDMEYERIAQRPPFMAHMQGIGDCIAYHADLSSVLLSEDSHGDVSIGIQLSKGGSGHVPGLQLYALMTPDQADAFADMLKEEAAKIRATAFGVATEALRKAAGK